MYEDEDEIETPDIQEDDCWNAYDEEAQEDFERFQSDPGEE